MNPTRADLLRYRVLANVVGVLLVVLILIGVPLKYAHAIWPAVLPVGSTGQAIGEAITTYLGIAHGWLYMGFLFTAFLLGRRARWEMPFLLVTLASGTVPLLSFWSEHRATQRVRRDYPDLA